MNIDLLHKIFDNAEYDEMSALMETAASWDNGPTSALRLLVETERVHNQEHRRNLIREIEHEICALNSSQTEFKLAETKSLRELRWFVMNFKIAD